tara:strand:+ start:14892 stop:16145 length:1254 start_codon:yes stop_codon:yes gene_type:complete
MDTTEDIPDFTISDTGPYMMNMTHLGILKSKKDDPFVSEEIARLILVADDLLLQNFEYVTDKDRPEILINVDRNDYVSLARYLWPDSSGAYTNERSGITNPEIYNYDRPKLARISNAIFYLSLAYFYTDTEDNTRDDYARKATELITNWFLNDETKMNPNLNYAQIALGVDDRDNSQGIIDTIDFIKVIDSISLIYDSRYWTHDKHIELKAWFYSFSKWIDSKYNSSSFCDEGWCNNVSTWLDAQKTIYFLFTEQEDRLNSRSSIQPIQEKILLQFTPEGRQPFEDRFRSQQHYYYYNLSGHMTIALMRKQRPESDRDWQFLNSPDFGGLKPSLDVIVNYLQGEDASDFFSTSDGFDNCRYLEILKPAAIAFDHQKYEDVSKQLMFYECSNLDISLTLPPLEWIDTTEEPETSSSFE